VLHLANGDDAAGTLRSAGLPGEVAVWADCLDQGPLQGRAGTAQCRAVRAAFLSSCGLGTPDAIRTQLDAWDAPLLLRPDELVLWFEADLNCQLALLHHLAVRPASLVLTPAPVSKYAPAELAAMFPLRTQPRAALVGLAQAGWSAVTSADPRAIERLLETDTSAMPFLAAALRRHLQEFPEPRSGLSRTDRQVLETNGDFKSSQAREEAPFMTDFFFGLRIEELQGKGLLRGGKITDRGRACLEGRLDYRSQADPRLVGGVLLEGPSCYRWDGASLVAP
jgi:hypothetical protein